jgi:hypothetical protein
MTQLAVKAIHDAYPAYYASASNPKYQYGRPRWPFLPQDLHDRAMAEYGSEEEAAVAYER